MAVTLASAENALKTVYLGVVSDQLNSNTNPLYNKIARSTQNIAGREIRKAAPIGINGGFGAGTEDGALPAAHANKYAQFVLGLKNLYGQIEISDKAVKASANSAGAMVNLLNAELEGLLKASKFNLGRMLYGDGTGKLCKVLAVDTIDSFILVDDSRNLIEGMVVDFSDGSGSIKKKIRIEYVDRATNYVYINAQIVWSGSGGYLTVQDSYQNEITGLGAIFAETGTLYGLNKNQNKWLIPASASGATFDETTMQSIIDKLEDERGSVIDMIVCPAGVRRAYQKLMLTYKHNIDIMDLAGGYKAISYNGIPVVNDRFAPKGTMYFLDTSEFALHQLCDWKWLESENGKIITQVPGKAMFTATLVKYADLICNKPAGQGKLINIAEK